MERGGSRLLSPRPLSHRQPAWTPWAVLPGWGQGTTEHSVSGMSQSGGRGGDCWTVPLLSKLLLLTPLRPGGGEDGPISRSRGRVVGLISV